MIRSHKPERLALLLVQRGAALVLFATLLLSGCASPPIAGYDALAKASQDIQSGSSTAYTNVEQRLRDFAIVTAPNAPLSPDTFTKLSVGKISFDISPELTFREQQMGVLVAYTTALQKLAGKDYNKDLDSSTKSLAGALAAIAPQAKAIVDIFATVVDELAKAAANRERKDALKKVMDRAQPAMEQLATLIASSNEKIAAYAEIMRDTYVRHANAWRPSYGTLARYEFDQKAADAIDGYSLISNQLTAVSNAAKKLPAAHAELRKSLDAPETPQEAIKDVFAEIQGMRGFYKGLESK